jgi:hypothetical protein
MRGMAPGLPEKWLLWRPFIGWPTPAWAVSESTGVKMGSAAVPPSFPFGPKVFACEGHLPPAEGGFWSLSISCRSRQLLLRTPGVLTRAAQPNSVCVESRLLSSVRRETRAATDSF